MKIDMKRDVIGINSDLVIHSGYDDYHHWGLKKKSANELTPDEAKVIAHISIVRWQALIDKIDRGEYET